MALIKFSLLAFILAQLLIVEASDRIKCIQVTLRSKAGRPASQIIRDESGIVRKVVKVKVWDKISKVPCKERVNYFYFGNILIARNGCQATFRVCFRCPEPTTTAAPLTTVQPNCQKIKLFSRRFRPVSKSLDNEVVSITLLKEFKSKDIKHRSVCRRGVTFGFDDNVVFAKAGCRGIFEVCTGPGQLTTTAPRVRCEDVRIVKTTRRTVRDANNELATITSFELVKEFSKWRCQEGSTYFSKGSVYVVKGGCKGNFRVCFEEALTTAALLTTTGAPKVVCDRVTVKSTRKKRGRVEVRDANGNPVEIVRVKVWDQLSKVRCIQFVNYFFSGSVLTTRGGCSAQFRVCYQVVTTTAAPLTTQGAPDPGCDFVKLISRKGKVAVVRFPDATISRVTLVRQFASSKVDCIIRRTYGFRANKAFARNGCRGLFQVCFDTAPLTTASPETCKHYKVLSPSRIIVYDHDHQLASITSVTLEREISEHECEEGVNYFSRQSRFFVKGECKGIFRVCYTPITTTAAPLTTTEEPVVCTRVDAKSRGLKPRRVKVTDRDGNSVIIVKVKVWDQISKVKCRRGINYFVGTSSITVKGGCAASFQVCYRPAPQTTPAPLTTTEAPETCKRYVVLKPTRVIVRDANNEPAVINSVVLRREISRHVCQEGKNYFFKGPAFIVKAGCKGVFRVCFSPKQVTAAPLATTEAPVVCDRIDVKSRGSSSRRVNVRDRDGNAVIIVRVKVWDLLSKVKCRRDVNYFVRDSAIIARDGCQATFLVCYRRAPQTTAAPLTTEAPKPKCKRVDPIRNRVEVTDDNGNPVEIVKVKVWDQISKIKCKQGITFVVSGNTIILRKGCKATFLVCFVPRRTTPAPLTTEAPETCNDIIVLKHARQVIVGSDGLPAEITRVQLLREISKHVCRRRINFFFRGSIFIVNGGCKGRFRVCFKDNPGQLTTTAAPKIECRKIKVFKPTRESIRDDNDNPATITSVRLLREFSKHICALNENYFFRKSNFIVRPGCKGIFEVCFSQAATTAAPLTTEAPEECRKVKVFKPTRESVSPATITSVRLLREFSKHVCALNENYFFRKSNFIVRPGCKGIFEICFRRVQTTAAPLTTEAPEPVCKRVTLRSRGNKEDRADLTDKNGNPVRIIKVKVWDQFSKVKCVRWVTYFFSESFIIAKKGCQASFEVCYLPKVRPTTAAPLTTTAAGPQCRKITLEGPVRREIHDDQSMPTTITDIKLLRDFSYGGCKRSTYKADGSFVIVRKHCKGVFLVCFVPAPTTAAPLTTTAGPVRRCVKIKLDGSGHRPFIKTISDKNDHPIVIKSIKVIREFSRHVCRVSVTFFASGNTVVAKKGCKGIFEVCYRTL